MASGSGSGKEADARGSASGPASSDSVLVTVDGRIGHLRLNRPERRNSLSWDMIVALRDGVARLSRDPDVEVIVLSGEGDKAFCSGADLAGMAAGDGYLALHEGRGGLASLFEDLWSCGTPTIAAVHGFCLAGGFGLALACDLVIAADDAQFGTPEIGVGLWPYMITVPLTRSMPPKRALELMMTGRRIDATEADRCGFLNAVVARADLDAEVARWASMLGGHSKAAMRLGRDSFYRVVDQSAGDALAMLHPMLTVHAGIDDAREGITAFLEKRPPQWSGS